MLVTLPVVTSRRCEMLDITAAVRKVLAQSNVASGTATIFVPHTTAAVTINENADPDVQHDLLRRLDTLIPKQAEDRHQENNSDAHLKSSLVGAGVTVIVEQGRLLLGTWQGIYFCEFDGPRQRQVHLKVSSG